MTSTASGKRRSTSSWSTSFSCSRREFDVLQSAFTKSCSRRAFRVSSHVYAIVRLDPIVEIKRTQSFQPPMTAATQPDRHLLQFKVALVRKIFKYIHDLACAQQLMRLVNWAIRLPDDLKAEFHRTVTDMAENSTIPEMIACELVLWKTLDELFGTGYVFYRRADGTWLHIEYNRGLLPQIGAARCSSR